MEKITLEIQFIDHPDSADYGQVYVQLHEGFKTLRSPLANCVRVAVSGWVQRHCPDCNGFLWNIEAGGYVVVEPFVATSTDNTNGELVVL